MVQNPEKELRFTRVRQARVFFVLAACHFIAIILLLCASFLPEPYGGHELRSHLWLIFPLGVAGYFLFKIALHCTKHAYIILTPLGIEIFPLIQPRKNLRLLYWTEIVDFEVKQHRIILHTNADKTTGVILSLSPISPQIRPSLHHAIQGKIKSVAH